MQFETITDMFSTHSKASVDVAHMHTLTKNPSSSSSSLWERGNTHFTIGETSTWAHTHTLNIAYFEFCLIATVAQELPPNGMCTQVLLGK
jgi:hypothetical protein